MQTVINRKKNKRIYEKLDREIANVSLMFHQNQEIQEILS